jgi:hypothetical protein
MAHTSVTVPLSGPDAVITTDGTDGPAQQFASFLKSHQQRGPGQDLMPSGLRTAGGTASNEKPAGRRPRSASDGLSQSSAWRLVAFELTMKPQPEGLGDRLTYAYVNTLLFTLANR